MARNFRTPTVSMRGVVVDMDAMRSVNEDRRAVGNGRMNSRGDILGQGGQIEIRREKIIRDYYDRGVQISNQVSLKPAVPDVWATPVEALATAIGDKAEIDTPAGLAPRPKGRRIVDSSED